MRTRSPWVGALLALATLAGCRTLPPPPLGASAPWQERRPQLQALQHFQLKGRVALSAGANGFNANLRWFQDGARSQLALEGPLGVGGMQISANGDDLDIINAHGEHITSAAAHAELSARLGFDIPLPSLRYWVLGVPDPAQPAQESLDPAQQRLAGLTQDGWHIAYGEYVAAAGETLPARLTLERDAVRVRLLVEDWQL
jgi:outer membrane lipoprotein LolB